MSPGKRWKPVSRIMMPMVTPCTGWRWYGRTRNGVSGMGGSFGCVLDMRDRLRPARWSLPDRARYHGRFVHCHASIMPAGRFSGYRAPRAVALLEDQRDTIPAAADFPLAGF